jgi:hypothetical protein
LPKKKAILRLELMILKALWCGISYDCEAAGRRVAKAIKAGKVGRDSPPQRIHESVDGGRGSPAGLCGYEDPPASPLPVFIFELSSISKT